MIIIFDFLILIVCFYLLYITCENYFIVSLEKIADKLKLSSDVAGATLMAVGSSAPELFIVLFSIIIPGNHLEIGIGTIVGSALFNLLFIIGAVGLISKSRLIWQPVVRDALFYFVSILLLIFILKDAQISLFEASILILCYVIYVFSFRIWKKIFPYKDYIEEKDNQIKNNSSKKFSTNLNKITIKILNNIFIFRNNYIFIFFASIIFIAFLSWRLVESSISIAHILNIPEAIISLTILAIGTSIPDLFSSLIVAKRGKGSMAISNAVGSNIFDILIGIGLPFFIYRFFSLNSITVMNNDITFSIILLLGTLIILVVLLLLNKWKLGIKSGLILITIYLAYLFYEILNFYLF